MREDFLWTVKWHKKACTGSLCHTPNLQKDWESHSYKDRSVVTTYHCPLSKPFFTHKKCLSISLSIILITSLIKSLFQIHIQFPPCHFTGNQRIYKPFKAAVCEFPWVGPSLTWKCHGWLFLHVATCHSDSKSQIFRISYRSSADDFQPNPS